MARHERSPRRASSTRRKMPRTGVLVIVTFAIVVAIAALAVRDHLPRRIDDLQSSKVATTAVVATDRLNIRDQPSTDGAILDTLNGGVEVTVRGEPVNGFLPIAYNQYQGWMAVDYLQVNATTTGVVDPVLGANEVSAQEPENVPAERVEVEKPDPTEPAVPSGEHWIEVDRSERTIYLRVGETAIASYPAKIGWDESVDGFYSTAVGTYHVFEMDAGVHPTPFAEGAYLKNWVGYDPVRHNGIHSPVLEADGTERAVQNPTTQGCVRLTDEASAAVYDFAFIGMRVEVHQ